MQTLAADEAASRRVPSSLDESEPSFLSGRTESPLTEQEAGMFPINGPTLTAERRLGNKERGRRGHFFIPPLFVKTFRTRGSRCVRGGGGEHSVRFLGHDRRTNSADVEITIKNSLS